MFNEGKVLEFKTILYGVYGKVLSLFESVLSTICFFLFKMFNEGKVSEYKTMLYGVYGKVLSLFEF